MSDINNTENTAEQNLPEEQPAQTTLDIETSTGDGEKEVFENLQEDKPKGYANKTAHTLQKVHLTLLTATILYVLLQCYLSITSYLQQMAPLSLALVYTFASVLMPAVLLLALAFLFKFFAEIVELSDIRNRNTSQQ